MDELIERIKQATGVDAELNKDILEATGGCAHRETDYYCVEDGNDYDSGFTCRRCGRDTYGQSVPNYTGSVDSAITLLPTGGEMTMVDLNLTWEPGKDAIWPAASVRWYPPHKSGPDWHAFVAGAATPALAICAAALRARVGWEEA